MQARRRIERANFREKMRKKHKLKSSHNDHELAQASNTIDEKYATFQRKDVSKFVKNSWQKLKESITQE